MARRRALQVQVGGQSQRQNHLQRVLGADRVSEDHPDEAGVNVMINGEHKATVNCGGPDKAISNLEGMHSSHRQPLGRRCGPQAR